MQRARSLRDLPPPTCRLFKTVPKPRANEPRMKHDAVKPVVDTFRNVLTRDVAENGTHKFTIFLVSDTEHTGTVQAKNIQNMETLQHSAHLRELSTIIFRKLFKVENKYAEVVYGAVPRKHFTSWFEKQFGNDDQVLACYTKSVTNDDTESARQPADVAANITAGELYTMFDMLNSKSVCHTWFEDKGCYQCHAGSPNQDGFGPTGL